MQIAAEQRTRLCTACGARWPASATVCPDDGARLIDAALITAADSMMASVSLAAPMTMDGSAVPYPSEKHTRARPIARGSWAPGELVAGMMVGEYRLEKLIGAGAMGAVYAARHPVLGKRVAIKVITPRLCEDVAAVERFAREARAVGQLHHPGIVGVHTAGTLPDGRGYLVMEWLDGETLRARLRRGRLPLEDALDIIVQMTRALDAAHEHLVIHRDIKPDNIYLVHLPDARPVVKLLDFGLAKLVDGEQDITATRTGQMLGTPLYCSPEQARAKEVGPPTDVYALGCVAYEIVCGRVPFLADNVAELIAAHQMVPAPRPRAVWSAIPLKLDALLLAMIAKDPADRPSLNKTRETISAVIRELAAPPPTPRLRVRVRARAWVAIAGAAGIVAIASAAWLRQPDRTAAQPQPPQPSPLARQLAPVAPQPQPQPQPRPQPQPQPAPITAAPTPPPAPPAVTKPTLASTVHTAAPAHRSQPQLRPAPPPPISRDGTLVPHFHRSSDSAQ